MNQPAPLDVLGREETIFNAAVQLGDPGKRAAYLNMACEHDPALRARLEKLLASDAADTFVGRRLASPVPPDCGGSAPAGPSSSEPVTQVPGERIGRYKLLQKIGEGGCGVVYMAEQEEPVRRRVALKIIKLGMDTQSVIARFEAERQALAMMDHANIAKIFDGGVTETGRPYFVMDLVQGPPIVQFCDEAKLSTRQRLGLFLEVCSAIQHAHQKGIIHRDIKPSNILVTLHSDIPVPKVIDFGIAKATQQRLTDKTVFTQFQQFIGTPAYMSPEQASLSGLDIDTRSDVYSLGVLLYELLTGKTPFDARDLLQAGLDEMRRTILEKEPERPSTRVSTLGGEELTTTARRRGLEPPKLVSTLRGDLDWIAMKCLEKDRARRYETANGLAADVQRHLSNEPVVASPPSNLYRLQKLVSRNKLAFSAAATAVVFLCLGLGGATWGFVTERKARRAEHARLEKAEVLTTIYKAKQLYQYSRREEAEKLLNEIPRAAIEPDSEHTSLRRMLTWWYAIHEEWEKAATNCALLEQVDGLEDHDDIALDRLQQSIVLVQEGDISGYESFRQKLLASSVPKGADDAGELCRLYLLLPADQAMLNKMDKLYEMVEHVRSLPATPSDWKAWFSFSLGLVDYRRGDFWKAVTNCQACVDGTYHHFSTRLRVPSAEAVLAMACHQLHQDKEASEALAKARKDDYPNLTMVAGDEFAWALFDGLYGHILLSEAEALVKGHRRENNRYYPTGEACLGDIYFRRGEASAKPEAVKWYRTAMEHGSPEGRIHLAWVLAISHDPKIRDGTNALRLAEEAVRAVGRSDTEVLDTLAAAYAETGQFEKAVATEKEALAINNDADQARSFEARLRPYESGKPYRE